jgi:excisionase family DNA binding protein
MNCNPFDSLAQQLHVIRQQLNTLTDLLRTSINSSPNTNIPTNGIAMATHITGLAKGTVYNLVSKRKIPHYKKNKKIYFDREELIAWIRAGRR